MIKGSETIGKVPPAEAGIGEARADLRRHADELMEIIEAMDGRIGRVRVECDDGSLRTLLGRVVAGSSIQDSCICDLHSDRRWYFRDHPLFDFL